MASKWVVTYLEPFSLELHVSKIVSDYLPIGAPLRAVLVEASEAEVERLREDEHVVDVKEYLPKGSHFWPE